MKNIKNTILLFLFRLLYAGIFLCAVFLNFSAFLGISIVTWRHMSVLLVALIALLLFRTINGKIRLQLTGLFGIVLILGMFFGSTSKWLSFLKRVWYLPLEAEKAGMGESLYAEYAWVVFTVLAGWLFYLLMEKYFALKLAAVLVLACRMAGVLFWNWQGDKAGTAFTMLFIVIVMEDWVESKWEKVRGENSYKLLPGIMPFLVVYLSILLILPVIEKPYDWQWAKALYQKTSEKLTEYTENLFHIGQEDMDFAMSGFSEKGSLFAGVQSENRELMKIRTGYDGGTALYLTGKIFDSFDGRNWRSRGGEDQDNRLMDVLEMSYALSRYEENDKWKYFKTNQLEMTYQYFHTDYLLAPSKAWEIKGENSGYHVKGENLLFDRNAGFGTYYSLKFSQLSMSREEFTDFLQWNGEESEDEWEKVSLQYTQDKIRMEELYAYSGEIKEKYSQKTEISPKVQDWILQHTEGAVTATEKLQRIEASLAAMEYNKNPGALPDQVTDERSFLDFFLLESQKGYCTHYATAFVLLARAEGFPARYVQGFCVPITNEKETVVYSDMAHAWPEIYIEGKGWIAFEPTPGYGTYHYCVREEETGEGLKEQSIAEVRKEQGEEAEIPEELDNIQEEDSASGHNIGKWMITSGYILLFMLLGFLLLFIMNYLWEKKREKGWDLRQRYQAAVLRNLRILEMLGIKREETETWQEFLERICDGSEEADKMPVEFIRTYEEVRYGKRIVDEDIFSEASEERGKLLATLKREKGRLYWLYRIRLSIISF